MTVIVRKAQLSDRDRIFPLVEGFATSFRPDRAAFDSSFSRLVDRDDALLLVAEIESELVGYCLCFDHLTFYASGRVAWIEELMVQETRRKRGIGKQLMSSAEEWAADRGSRLVALATRRAAAFYGAIGYEESAVYFRKVLSSES